MSDKYFFLLLLTLFYLFLPKNIKLIKNVKLKK